MPDVYRRSARVVAFLVLVVTIVAVGLHPSAARAQTGPIKIGMLAPLTGAAAALGKDLVSGTELYLDESGRQAAGRAVQLIVEDDEGQPATALSKARKLVEQDKVHVLTGAILGHLGYALAPFVDSQRIPMVLTAIAVDDLTQRRPAKWIVRTGWSTSQPMHPFGEWVIKNTKYRKIVTISLDYAFGYETVGGFQRTFEDNGGQVVQKIWPPLNVNDFAPFLASIRRDADAVFALAAGRSAVQFMKQYAAAGLKSRLPLLGGGVLTDESVLPQMGDEAIGTLTALHYSAALDTPQNQKFAKAFEAKAGKVPSYFAEVGYTGARWIVEATKARGGKVEDREQFLTALRHVNVKDAPRGPIAIDQWRNPVQNIYIRRVDKVGGKLQNTVIATFTGVSQFWKYKPEEFLRTPVYSRDYPLCRYC